MLLSTAIRSALAVASALLCASLLGAPRLFAQDAPPEKSDADAKQEKARGDALVRVRGLADRIERMRDPDVKIRALAQLADITCKYDKTSAELIFHRARRVYEASARSVADATTRRQQESLTYDVRDQRRALFQRMANCLPDLALRLSRSNEDESDADALGAAALSDIVSATELLNTNTAQAAVFAERGLQAPLDLTRAIILLQFLHSLRTDDAAAADRLFIHALSAMRTEPRARIGNLLLLSNYLFGPPGGLDLQTVRIGTASVPRILALRPGMSAELVRGFFETALDILSRPLADPNERVWDLGALYQLVAKSREFAPDLTPAFELLFERTGNTLMDFAALNSQLAGLRDGVPERSADSLSERLRQARDPVERDGLLLQLAIRQLWRGQPDRAREHIIEVTDLNLRGQLTRLADFVEAARGLTGGNLDMAYDAINRMPAGPPRSLVNLGYAAQNYRGAGRGNEHSARASVNLAERDIERLPPRVKAHLLVAAAAISALHDPDPLLQQQNTLAILRRVVAAFNAAKREEERLTTRLDSSAPRTTMRDPRSMQEQRDDPEIRWQADAGGVHEVIAFSAMEIEFRLDVKGVDIFELRDPRIFARLGQSARSAETILSQLEDDSVLAPALAALAAAYLEDGFRKPAVPTAARAEKSQ